MAEAPSKLKSERRTRARIDRYGRILIPAEMREQLGIRPDEAVSLRIEDGELRIITIHEGIRRAQTIAAKYTKGRTGLVDEFLADRRRDTGE